MIDVTATDTIETLKSQLELIYDGDPWYGNSIKSVIRSVNPELVFDSPGPGMHTIAELAAHMLTYRIFTEDRLQGSTKHPPEQEETFNWMKFSPDKKLVWEAMTDLLDSNQQNLLALLDQHDDSILAQRVAGKSYTFHYLLTGILQHDLYHLGQIVYVNKLLGKEVSAHQHITGYNFEIFSFENLAQLK